MTVLIDFLVFITRFVLGLVNYVIGLGLSLVIFDFPFIAWASVGGILVRIFDVFGLRDDDSEEVETND
jgi:hypothetical protein